VWGANDVLGEVKSALPARLASTTSLGDATNGVSESESAAVSRSLRAESGPGLQQSGQSQATRTQSPCLLSSLAIALRVVCSTHNRSPIAVQSRRTCHVGLWSLHISLGRHRSSRQSSTTGLAACALHCCLTGRRTSGDETAHRLCRPPQQWASVR
jgi:hypothetical protein